jgi:CDP-glycerol glycerophosphotransferase
VYGVAGYLRECLDSILTQSFTDVEIVAIDDCSPDSSGAILEEYASRDARVRVIHLNANVGLGPARNTGLDESIGDYVWFVDSDDWISPGALKAIASSLRRNLPDVLLIDHVKVWMSGRARRSPMRRRLPESTLPPTFDARTHPNALRPVHTAWSRIFRRQYLLDTGVRFQAGWYEDVSLIYPATAAAKRISALHRVCYNYRQRRTGSITGSHSDDRHFDMFDQYAIVWSELDRLSVTDPVVRSAMFDRMQWHYRWVLGETSRVPRRRRHEFFTRVGEDYRRYEPPEHIAPPGMEGVKQRLFAHNAWATFTVARTGRRTVGKAKITARRGVRLAKRTTRRGAHIAKRIGTMAYYRAQRLRPVDPHLAVYAAYWYRGVRCNPAAIYEKARELAPAVHGVWIVKRDRLDDVPPGVDVVVEGSRRYFQVLARARYLVNNVNFPNLYVKRNGSVFLQTHHGTPLKTMGMEHYRYPIGAQGTNLPALLRRCDNWDISLSTSPFNSEVWQRSYPCEHETLEVGYPRNDRLAVATGADVADARAALGLDDDEMAVLFAPTHREYQSGYQSPLDVEELADALGPGVRVLSRPHYYYDKVLAGGRLSTNPGVLDVSGHPDVELLYLAADVLITDYSSMMFDYAYLDRPIVIFAPDWDTYRRTRGVTFDLMSEPPGAVAETFRDLVDAFATGEISGEAATKARADFRERFCPHVDGRSSELVVRRVFLNDLDLGESVRRSTG